MPPTPDLSASLNSFEAPMPAPPEQCVNPLGCLAVVTLYDAARSSAYLAGEHTNGRNGASTETLSPGDLHIQAIEAEVRLALPRRCVRCPLRRTTIYYYPEDHTK